MHLCLILRAWQGAKGTLRVQYDEVIMNLKKITACLFVLLGAMLVVQAASAKIYVPQTNDANECKRKQLNNRDCGNWYSLEKVRTHSQNHKSGVYNNKQNWYTVGSKPQPRKIVLNGVKFDVNKATIKAESYSILQRNIAELKSNPKVKIQIVGHTDADGSDDANQTLSEARALSVLNFFVQHGVGNSRMTSFGKGETQPISSNTTTDGKAKNRRIEIHMN
jgi:outer membrane protein OmpA-like peptidoglycan-associated protein